MAIHRIQRIRWRYGDTDNPAIPRSAFPPLAGKLSVLADIQNQKESGQLSCPLQFPKHHKRYRQSAASNIAVLSASTHLLTCDNIKKTIYQAYDDAYDLLSKLDVHIPLKKAKKN